MVASQPKGVLEVVISHDAGTWLLWAPDWEGFPAAWYRAEGGGRSHRYFTQLNNARDPERTCFSSSAAMVLSYHIPDAIESDDDYIDVVFSLGDTTEASTQLAALKSYGLDCTFSQNKSIDWLKEELGRGNPVCLGILHRGPAEAPTGSGHWVYAYHWDFETNEALVHDPYFGSYNHQLGTYCSDKPGEAQRFSEELLGARWTVEGPNSGWCLYLEKEW